MFPVQNLKYGTVSTTISLVLGTRNAFEAKQLNCELEQFHHLSTWSTILFLF